MIQTELEQWIQKEYEERGITSLDDLTIENLCSQFNVDLVSGSRGSKSFASNDSRYYLIFLNRDQPIQKQRLDFFHELGHVLKHVGDQRIMPIMFREYLENKAYQFTLYASMPKYIIEPHLSKEVRVIAELFKMPLHIVESRVEQLSRNLHSTRTHIRPQESKRLLKSRSYNPDKWTSETWRVIKQLREQTGQEVIDYESIL
ncbi:ImmA/IrrE family metallo-endopeptidase [Salibacterium aidingense]|uniref:ImmA/IrrE family metallo-endopeptidase n=1 Tax=Salibacterium aidingense TaxID=384933 RepID=UPI0003F5E491|nr:ImmA/IrrE family metallo-endopeptidase [Salibacterium aidingense]